MRVRTGVVAGGLLLIWGAGCDNASVDGPQVTARNELAPTGTAGLAGFSPTFGGGGAAPAMTASAAGGAAGIQAVSPAIEAVAGVQVTAGMQAGGSYAEMPPNPQADASLPVDVDAEMEMEMEAPSESDLGSMSYNSDTSCPDPVVALDPALFNVSQDASLYELDADSLPGLRSQMTSRSPASMAAATSWVVRYDFDWERCDGSGLQVDLEIHYDMPTWNQPAVVEERVVAGWTGFIDALWCHELGHGGYGVKLAQEAREALAALSAPRGCLDLRLRAQRVFDEVFQRIRGEEVAYDETTNHGASMGARLCPNEDTLGCR